MEFIWRLDAARWIRPALVVVPVLVASATFAASEGEHREHEAHEHGHGALDIAVEGEELVVEFRIPAVNVVGFEHAPGTDAEREAVRQAIARFADPTAVVVPPPDAECEPERAEADFRGMDHEGSHEQHEEDGHEHEHEHGEDGSAREKDEDEDHDHDEHRGDEHESGESGAEAHSELHATYHFHCHAPERLDRLQVRVFELLHDAEEIEVRVVTPALQKATELHPGDTVVDLSR